MAVPGFMTPEHVFLMNGLLSQSQAVRDACRRLPRDMLIAHQLANEDGGAEVWWQTSFSCQDGMRFRLGKPDPAADLTVQCGYWAMLEMVKAQRNGTALESSRMPVIGTVGDAQVLQATREAFALAQPLVTVPVEFPQRGRTGGTAA